MSQIPTLDIRRFDTDRTAFVADLGAASREWGFCGIRGHGISDELIQGAYDATKAERLRKHLKAILERIESIALELKR